MGGPPKVLVADDDDEIRALICGVLRNQGFFVVALANGDQLVQYIEAFANQTWVGKRPDAVVTDLRMPGPSRLGIIEAIRHVDPLIPIVVVTAAADDVIRAQAIRSGACAVIGKPFHLVELTDAIAAALAGRARP